MNQNDFSESKCLKRKPHFLLPFRPGAVLGLLMLTPTLHAAEQDIVAARSALERGHVLTQTDLQLKTLQASGTRAGYLTDPKDAIGMTLKRRLHADQPITRAHLDSPVLIERGQRVLMVAMQDGIEARTVGEAMKKGRKGELIKVKNESSQRVVSAVVTDAGVVRMPNAGVK